MAVRLPVVVGATFLLVITAGLIASISFWRQAEQTRAAEAEQRRTAIAARDAEAEQRRVAEAPEFEQSRAREESELARASEEEQRKLAEQATLQARAELDRVLKAEAEARAQHAEAQRQASISDEVNKLLQDDLLRSAKPEQSGHETTVREVLDNAAEALKGRFENEPLIKAEIHHTLTETFSSLGALEETVLHAEQVLRIYRAELGGEHADTLHAMNDLALGHSAQDRFAEAATLALSSVAGHRRVLGDEHPHTLTSISHMGGLLQKMGKLEEAEALLAEAVAGAKSSLPEGHWYTGAFLAIHGKCLAELKRYAEAETALLEARRTVEAALGTEHERTIGAINALVDLYDVWREADHDAKAAEWRAELGKRQASTQPAETPPANGQSAE